MKTILVVDDQKNYLIVLEELLRGEGFEVVTKRSAAEAAEVCRRADVDLLLTDMRMAGMDGIQLLSEVLRIDPDLPVILMTAFATVEKAVEAMKKGAYDYILKPFRNEELLAAIRQAVQVRELRHEHRQLQKERASRAVFESQSPPMREAIRLAEQVAPSATTVLLSGESGTGKEILARALHAMSPRAERFFIPANCAAIPESLLETELFGHQKGAFTGAVAMRKGLFERADGGTLFLDEVSEMTPHLQAKVLRVLQEREFERVGGEQAIRVDVRIIAATNKDLRELVEAGRFREDLFYRLFVFHIHLPSLRERAEDILPLAGHFVRQFAAEMGKPIGGLTPEAQAALAAHRWPGNIRELRNAIERAVVLCAGRLIDERDLPGDVVRPAGGLPPAVDAGKRNGGTLAQVLEQYERQMIVQALARAGGVQARAARELGISRSNFQYRMTRLGLREPSGEGGDPQDRDPAPRDA
ncbi:MAG: Fis family transcriptional regulator [Candidatus Tectomicrobia bacterium RIFCSPLOWO2_12_FULL_69_37]|nr:MAG: Fis family transcriptional regulator [Candidatus Tectomicrobia bacterium RIFCSPLOWO2_02_FULL_70_19]OGL68916.1 MAG: Fis family transcriptional regulator [Candidatus Tectomicrobia bacterium RIFCSPLOWO2_12_FULL_69_37]